MSKGFDAACPGGEVWNGKHPPLVLGWRDDQIAPVVELLAPFLADDLTPEMTCAVAACARSMVVDFRLTRRPVRYSRRKDHYGRPARYRQGDRYYTYHYVPKAVDLLGQAGLAGQDRGVWYAGGGGRQSVAWPTERLVKLLEPVIGVDEARGVPPEVETIVLRDKNKKELDYADTAETDAMRVEVEALNQALGQLELYWLGKPFPIPVIRRIFNDNFNRGGRLYCYGSSYQNIPAEDRLDMELVVDGVQHPVVEIDYRSLHITMAYAETRLPLPAGDQYAIDGFDRTLVKLAVNTLFNATTRHTAVCSLSEELHGGNYPLWRASGLTTRHRKECRPLAERVVLAVEDKNKPIADFFGTDCGASFQRRDSDMAVQVMSRVLERTGRCPLPMHDSFLVADIDEEVLAQTMQEVALEQGLPLSLCRKTLV